MKGFVRIICVFIFLLCNNTAFAQQVKNIENTPGGNPMTCFIEAKVISSTLVKSKHTHASPSYEVRAKLLSVSHCGSSVPMALNPGDVVEIIIMNSRRLRKGDSFKANAEERLRMGRQPEILVFSYELNKRI